MSGTNVGNLLVRLLLERDKFRADLRETAADAEAGANRVTRAAGAITEAVSDAAQGQVNVASMAARSLSILGPAAGVAVAAAVAVGAAYHQAQKESEAYQRSIILTGNAAGVTAGQLSDMARRIDGVAGTHAQAAATLAQMTGTAQVARGNLEKVSLAAIEMERASVQSIGESVKVFADLGKAPVAASLRLNESMNYLTASTFEQIKAAEQMGRAEEAASIAQNAYADAARERTAKVEQNLGTLQKVMRSVRDAASEMWDSILNIGREQTNQERLDATRKRIADLENQIAGASSGFGETGGGAATGRARSTLRLQAELSGLQAQAAALEGVAYQARASAEAEREKQAAENAGIALSTEASKHDSALEKQRKAVAQATAQYTTAIQREGMTQQERAQIDANYLKIVSSLTQEKEKAAKPRGGRKESGGDPYAAERAGAQEWAKVMVTAGKAVETVEGKTQGLNAAQQALLGYLESPAYAQNSEDMRQAALARLYAWDAAIKHADATKAEAEAVASASKAMVTWQDASAKETQGLKAQVAARKEEAAALGLSAVEVAGLTAAKHEQAAAEKEAYAAALESAQLYAGEYSEAYATAAEAAREQARLLRELAGSEVSTAGRRAMLDEWKQTVDKYDDVFRTGFADMLNSGKDGWKSFTKSLATTFKTTVADQLYKAFAQPFVVSVVGNLLGLAGSAGLSSAGQAAAGGGAGGVMGLLNAGSSIYSALTNGISGSISSAFSNFAASGVGQSLGLSNSAAIVGNNPSAFVPAGGQLTGLGQGIGAGLGMLGSGFAGYGLSKMISGGYTTGGNTVNALAGVASAFLGPLAGVVGGLINRAFGRKLKDVGVEGTLGGADGFDGQAYQFYKGGWLRSDKTKYRELDADTAGMLSSSFKAIQAEVGTFATVLGLEAGKIASFTTSFKVSTKGLDEAGIQQAFQDALLKGSNELAQQVLGTWTSVTREVTDVIQSGHWDTGYITEDVTRTVTESTYAASEYAKAGEEAIDTLRRLATSLIAVNTMSDAMGQDLQLSGLAGAAAASKIAEAFGGLEAYAQTMGSYFQNYYSDAEQRAAVARQASRALADVGLDFSADKLLAATRPQIRAFVDGVAAQFGEDSAQYVAAVQQANALSAILTPLQSAVRTASTAMDDLDRAVSAERDALRARLDVAQDIANTLGGVFDVLHSNVRELYGEVGDTRAMLAQQGGDFITAALATAKKSGYLPDQDQLAEAIGAVRAGLADGFDVDSAERDYATKVLAGQLSEMEKIAGKQLTDAQRTVKELETHTGQLDQTLEYWRRQISLAEGTQDATLSVAEAVGRLQDFLGSGGTGTGGTGTGTGKPSGGGGGGGAGGITAGSDYQRVGYGADEALGSFDKFSAWYQGLRSTANVGAMTDGGYKRPDWMRVAGMADDGTDKELFAQYQFFKNNPQYAADYQQIMTTGRSSYGTDGSTLVRSDLSKMPADAAAYYKDNTAALLMAEGFLLDPVLAYQLYRDGPERFGLDRRKESFTEWLRSNQWSAEGVVAGNNAHKYAGMDYAHYNLTKWDTATGTLVGRDGIIYTPDGKPVGKASASQMQELYGNSNSRLYNQTTSGGTSSQDYYTGLRQQYDKDIADGKSAQYLADNIRNSGASMQDIATAYGISVDVLKENLRLGGATDIPQFAGGGYHAGGLRIVGEEGWEVEATGPSRIWNQRQLAQALTGGGSNAQLEALVQSLMAEIKLLRQSVDRGSDHAGDTKDALRSVINANALIVEMAPSALS